MTVTRRGLARAVTVLRAAAALGASGWRSSQLPLLHRAVEGMDAATALVLVMLAVELRGEPAFLWSVAILEPIGCGNSPDSDQGLPHVVSGRRTRPPSLAEVWAKLADKVAAVARASTLRANVEPMQ